MRWLGDPSTSRACGRLRSGQALPPSPTPRFSSPSSPATRKIPS